MFASADTYIPQCGPKARSLRRPLLVWASAGVVLSALAGLIVVAPLALARGHTFLAHTIYQSFGPLCHQLPERSFYVAGHAFAVCARCTGLYAGLAAGVLLFPLVRSLRRTDAPARIWLLIAAAPTALDFSLGFLGIWSNTHLSRFITGALLGTVAALFIVPGLIDLGMMSWRRFHTHDSARDPANVKPAQQIDVAASVQSAPSDYSWPSSRI
jgi:uncharacterized membrane protein